MKAFGLNHDNRVIIDLSAYVKKADDGSATTPKSIEIITAGEWDTPYHGKFTITADDLLEMVAHADLRTGLPIDREHDDDGGAAGWITNLRVAPSSADPSVPALWGDAEWTPQAAQEIKDGVYKFFSPEFYPEGYLDPMNGDEYDNVLIGGGLTNRPLMRNLAPVAANETQTVSEHNTKKVLTANSANHTIYIRKHNDYTMNIEDLSKKPVADLSDEERAFVRDHASELTDEQKESFKDVLVEDPAPADPVDPTPAVPAPADPVDPAPADPAPADPVEGSDKKTVTMSEAEAATLRKQAAEGSEAMQILRKKEAHEHTGKMIVTSKGSFPVEAHDGLTNFYMSLNDKQQKQFNDLVTKLPKAEHLLKVRGSDGGAEGSAVAKVKALVSESMKANDKLSLKDAQIQVSEENPTLMSEYYKEIEGR